MMLLLDVWGLQFAFHFAGQLWVDISRYGDTKIGELFINGTHAIRHDVYSRWQVGGQVAFSRKSIAPPNDDCDDNTSKTFSLSGKIT
jgi:hypothetical protein